MHYRLAILELALVALIVVPPAAYCGEPKIASIQLGKEVRGEGMTLDEGPMCQSRAVTSADRECRSTDKDREQYSLRFRIGPGFVPAVGSWPVRVTIEYYATDCGRPVLCYRSPDPDLRAAGREKCVPLSKDEPCEFAGYAWFRVGGERHTGWQAVKLDLPDAAFEEDGWTFAITDYAWRTPMEDVAVSSVKVELGGVALTAMPLVTSRQKGEPIRLIARVIGPEGEVLKGPVTFSADAGTVEPEADGLSAHYVRSPYVLGPPLAIGPVVIDDGDARRLSLPLPSYPVNITAQYGDHSARMRIVVTDRPGPMLAAEQLISDFQEPEWGQKEVGCAAQIAATRDGQTRSHTKSYRISYRFTDSPKPGDCITIESAHRHAPLGIPEAISLWVYGDGSGNQLSLTTEDLRDSIQLYELGYLDFTGWRKLTVHIAPFVDPEFGSASSPPRSTAITLSAAIWRPGHKTSGTIYLDEISFQCAVPQSESIELAVSTDPATVIERPRQPVQVQINVRNLVTLPRLGMTLTCTVKGKDGEVVKRLTQALELPASEEKVITFTVIPPRVGSYHVEANLSGGGLSVGSTADFVVGLAE